MGYIALLTTGRGKPLEKRSAQQGHECSNTREQSWQHMRLRTEPPVTGGLNGMAVSASAEIGDTSGWANWAASRWSAGELTAVVRPALVPALAGVANGLCRDGLAITALPCAGVEAVTDNDPALPMSERNDELA